MSRILTAVLVVVFTVSAPSSGSPRGAGAEPAPVSTLDGLDLSRPRFVVAGNDVAMVRARLDRDPYRALVRDMTVGRILPAPPPNLADRADCVLTTNRNREGAKAKAAKDLGFLYLMDRRWDGGSSSVISPTPAERTAMGDLVRDYLLAMCTEARIKVQTDRDINTSHELLQYAEAYDFLLAGGYPFTPGEEDAIRANLTALTDEYHRQYTAPDPLNFQETSSAFLTNNHRSKGAASIGVAALVLADPAHPDPRITTWLDFAFDRVDLVQRWTYGTADGGYGESTHYWRFAAINLIPFLRAWDRIGGGAGWRTQAGLTVPSLWRHPQFAATQRWMIDLTLPDGTLAPFDDGNVGERMWFGAFDPTFPLASVMSGLWTAGGPSAASDASIDMAPDQIAAFDDTLAATAPSWSPTQFWPDGGNVVFRSAWNDPDARMVVVQGEHDAAREFGRTRGGVGEVGSAPHDHPDPGSWMLNAYGERLMIDPGYVDYDTSLHRLMNKPSDHNIVLVGSGTSLVGPPRDPLTASWDLSEAAAPWFAQPGATAPVDGDAFITDTLDGAGVDAATVSTTYADPGDGLGPTSIRRRFLHVGDRYLVTVDDGASASPRPFAWPLHGNGGGTSGVTPALPALTPTERPPLGARAMAPRPFDASGGTFALTASGGVWSRPAARVTVGMSTDAGPLVASTSDELFEDSKESLGQYTALTLSAPPVARIGAVTIAYPSPTTESEPSIAAGAPLEGGGAGLRLDHPAQDRTVWVAHRQPADAGIDDGALATGANSGDAAATDGDLLVADLHADGSPRTLHAEGATWLRYRGVTYLQGSSPGTLSIMFSTGRVDVVADNDDPSVVVRGLPFAPTKADGACGLDGGDSGATAPFAAVVALGTERRFSLRTDGPGDGPGADARVMGAANGLTNGPTNGPATVLDGSHSCDPDGGSAALRYSWRVVAAPPGSPWSIAGADTESPVLDTSVPGQYRVRLVVTDADGQSSAEVELTVRAEPVGPVDPLGPSDPSVPRPAVAVPNFTG